MIVPLGNYQVVEEALSNAAQSTKDLTTLINESKSHVANVAWGLTNEITGDSNCKPTSGSASITQQCLNLLVSACMITICAWTQKREKRPIGRLRHAERQRTIPLVFWFPLSDGVPVPATQ